MRKKSMHLMAGIGLTMKSSVEVYIQEEESSLCSRCWHRGAGRSTAPRCVSPPLCTARTCHPGTQLRGLWWSPGGRRMGSHSKHVCWAALSRSDWKTWHHSGVSFSLFHCNTIWYNWLMCRSAVIAKMVNLAQEKSPANKVCRDLRDGGGKLGSVKRV